MTEHFTERAVAFCSLLWQEMANRRMEGILRYIDDSGGSRVRDFRFLDYLDFDDTAPPPSWTHKADGAIICFGVAEAKGAVDDAYRWLRRGGVPVVSLAREWCHPKIPIVCTDNNAVMRIACDYLVKLGHRHLALVGDTINPGDITRRRKVFRKLLTKPGRELLYCDLAERPTGAIADIDRALGDLPMVRFLREAPKPLSVFAITDLHARAICCICQELGLDIPGEVAILGCGNLSISRSHSPTISSVQTPHDRVGYEAMKMLHHLMDGGKPPARPKLIQPTEVIERESTCPHQPTPGDVRRALEFIRAHACEGISVKEVANNLSMARRTLGKHFKEYVGHSPGEEIQRIRLIQVKKLLTETGLSIIRISQMTGFREPTRLNDFFRKQTGLTPSEYRKQNSSS